MTALIFLAGMLVLFWLLVALPQRRRRARQAELVGDLKAGEDVLTIGGLYGTIREVGDYDVVLEIAPDTRVRVAKSAVSARAPAAEAEATEAPET